MKPEDRLLFACTRQDFQEQDQKAVLEISREYPLSWELAFSKAERHGVASLVYVNLCQRSEIPFDIPQKLVDSYQMYTMQNTVRKEQRARKLAEIIEYLNEHDIEAMLIKGGVLDILVYEHPAFSTLSDIDLVLHRKREEISSPELDRLMDELHGSSIEYDFYHHHDMTINGALPVDFDRIWQDASRIEYRGQPVWVMSAEDTLISLCINSCRKRYFRLKSLLDISETIRVMDQLRWDVVVEKAGLYDCSSIVYTALLVAERTLGCDLPEGVRDELKVSTLRSAVIDSLVSYAMRYSSLPLEPISGINLAGRQLHASLVLPYATYRLYQIRHKLFEEIL